MNVKVLKLCDIGKWDRNVTGAGGDVSAPRKKLTGANFNYSNPEQHEENTNLMTIRQQDKIASRKLTCEKYTQRIL